MKTLYKYPVLKSLTLFFVASLTLLIFDSCATRAKFLNSSIVPGAEGVVSVKQDNNENYHIKISTANLAEATQLQSPKNTYVVWMEGEDNTTKNIGQIKSSKSLLSKSLKGSFETVSSVKPKKVFLTAENDPSAQYPDNSDIILTTGYIKD